MGQRRVNKLTPDRPNKPDKIWRNKAIRGANPRPREEQTSTLNPKAASSNPARPIRSEKTRESRRQAIQKIREGTNLQHTTSTKVTEERPRGA